MSEKWGLDGEERCAPPSAEIPLPETALALVLALGAAPRSPFSPMPTRHVASAAAPNSKPRRRRREPPLLRPHLARPALHPNLPFLRPLFSPG